MAANPFPIASKPRVIGFGQGRGDLFEAATQTNARPRVRSMDDDTPRLVSETSRRELVTLSRYLFANYPVVAGVCMEMADLASQLSMRFTSEAEAWNEQTQDWLSINDEVISTTGDSMELIRYLAALAVIIDGDIGFVLTESKSGIGKIQPINGHRIGNRDRQNEVEGGPFDGARLIDGVAINRIGTPVAYQVLGDDKSDDVIYSANNFVLVRMPFKTDQLRGVPLLASGVNDWQDVKLTKKFELAAQKLGAYQGLIETNESGEPEIDMAKQLTRSTDPTVSGGAETTTPEVYSYSLQGDGALVRWFKAGQGGLQAFRNDRPSGDSRAFWRDVVREALCGIGASYDFAVDPTSIGGAVVRLVIDRMNRSIAKQRRHAIQPFQKRIDGFRIAKAIKKNRIPFNIDWFRREYSGGADLTADTKHQSDTAIQNVAAGFSSVQDVTEALGKNWKTVIREKIAFRKFLNEESEKAGVNPGDVVARNPKNPQAEDSQPTQEDD